MEKVSIITRCYNKLEYTIKCIDSIAKNTKYDNYEHIIINNNSTDGTKEWLNWINKNGLEYFNKIKPYNMEKNYGDWGGMLKGLELVSDDSEYILQVDNDIEIFEPEWIQKMKKVLEQKDVNIIQLKRKGMIKNIIKPTKLKTINYKKEKLTYGISPINKPVAFFMLKTKDFKRVKDKLPLDLVNGKKRLSELLGGTYKLTNLECNMIEPYFFREKYPRDKTYEKINII
ncbi:MAG: glycosyltransferase family 2 protein [bacterium]